MTIIGLLTVATASSLGFITMRARNTQRQSDLTKIQNALENYRADQGFYPAGGLNPGLGGPPASFKSDPGIVPSLTNCTGIAASCTVSRTYLQNMPNDPVYHYTNPGGDCRH